MKNWLILFLALIITCNLTGCWDNKDLDQLSFVTGVAFDVTEEEDKFMMTVELPVLMSFASSDGGSSNRQSTVVLSTTGSTIAHSIANFEARVWRRLFFGHTQVVIFSEELARSGIGSFIDYFDRNARIDRRLKLVIAQDEAQDVFNTENPREPITANYLNQMLDVVAPTTRVITQNFQDSLRNLEFNGDTILPRVRAEDIELTVAGGAIIKDYKFIAWLGENETRAAQFLYNSIPGGLITVNCDDNIYNYAIRRSDTKITPSLDNGIVTFTIDITSEGDISEVFQPIPRGPTPIPIDQIQADLNSIIENEITHLLTKLQDLTTDPIAFGRLLYRKYPDYWQQHRTDWKSDTWPDAKFTINCDFRIRRIGILE